MAGQTADETMDQLVAAVNARDLDRALALYHRDGTFVPERGKLATGIEEIRAAWTELFASKPELAIPQHETVESGDIALYSTKWTLSLTGPDGAPVKMTGKRGVVLRRQPDRTWLIAIENPGPISKRMSPVIAAYNGGFHISEERRHGSGRAMNVEMGGGRTSSL
jgi:uncharacterized protein (TIGR02246 family)